MFVAEVFAAKGGMRLPVLARTSQHDVRPRTLQGAVLSTCRHPGLAAGLLARGRVGLSQSQREFRLLGVHMGLQDRQLLPVLTAAL